MPIKVLVTGSAGFLGSHTVDVLLEHGHTVMGVDSLIYGRPENFSHLAGHPRFSFVQADVRDIPKLTEACKGADAIIHLAAFKIPRYGGALETLLVNTDGTRNVLDIARDGGRKVVLASTSDVYGKSPDLPFEEEGNLVLGPSTVKRWAYAASKLFDEHLVLAYMEEYGFPVVPLRFFGSYGPRHHLSWWGGPQSVFITATLKGDRITIHGDGLQTRSFTYVSDTVDGIVRATEMHYANGEIVNLGATREVTIVDLARIIHELSGVGGEADLQYIPYESFTGKRYEDVMRRVPDCTKAKKLLNWQAKVDLEEGLRRTIEWHRAAMVERGELAA
jgi:UDP-glucose 4-epimerase